MAPLAVSLCVPLVALGLTLALPGAASAAAFTVKPTQITLSSRTTSTIVTVTNESQRQMRFEIRAVKWLQDDRGTLQLSPAGTTISVTPLLLTLAPGASRNVRVAAPASAFGAVEGTYRLFVEELPDASAPIEPGAVAIRMEVGVPIFLNPARPASSGQIVGAALEQGKLAFRVRNTGNVHMVIGSVKMQAVDASGAVKLDRSQPGWYVLAGDARVFEESIASADCAGAQKVAVTVEFVGGMLKTDVPVPNGACGGPPAR